VGHSESWRVYPYGPHLLYIVLHDRGPPTTSQLGTPDQGVIKDSDSVVGPSRTRSILTFSPLILSYLLTSYILNSTHFITDKCIEHVSS
jgi:hypothetical protein